MLLDHIYCSCITSFDTRNKKKNIVKEKKNKVLSGNLCTGSHCGPGGSFSSDGSVYPGSLNCPDSPGDPGGQGGPGFQIGTGNPGGLGAPGVLYSRSGPGSQVCPVKQKNDMRRCDGLGLLGQPY